MPKPIRRQRWSNIDVFGLLNGISTWDPQYQTLLYVRGPADTTLDIRDKIFRAHNHPTSLTKQGLLNGVSNEFEYEPYNVVNRNVFQLTNSPFPSGDIGVQDIHVQYRDINSTGNWNDIAGQVWGQTYEYAKENKQGFIVWQNEKYINISGVKNFTYSRTLEIMQELPDLQELRVIYLVRSTDENNNLILKRYTDIDNLADNPGIEERNFLYRKAIEIDPISGVTVYTLNDIPTGLYSYYYGNDDRPLEQLYTVKDYLNNKFKHTWGTMSDASVIWDIHKSYGSGNIPHYFDSAVPLNYEYCLASGKANGNHFSGYLGGVEYLSQALYFDNIIESGDAQYWYFTVYPGRFYLDGVPFYLFEDPSLENITFVSGQAALPSGVRRGAKVILARSGYYDGCIDPDPYLSGYIFEDHGYPYGEGGDSCWSYIYRRRGFVPSGCGYDITLEVGEYNIDFKSGVIYAQLLDADATIIWDNTLVPSGRVIEYDINPLNDSQLNLQKYFIYLVNKEN